jgi:hypothetical protein
VRLLAREEGGPWPCKNPSALSRSPTRSPLSHWPARRFVLASRPFAFRTERRRQNSRSAAPYAALALLRGRRVYEEVVWRSGSSNTAPRLWASRMGWLAGSCSRVVPSDFAQKREGKTRAYSLPPPRWLCFAVGGYVRGRGTQGGRPPPPLSVCSSDCARESPLRISLRNEKEKLACTLCLRRAGSASRSEGM